MIDLQKLFEKVKDPEVLQKVMAVMGKLADPEFQKKIAEYIDLLKTLDIQRLDFKISRYVFTFYKVPKPKDNEKFFFRLDITDITDEGSE